MSICSTNSARPTTSVGSAGVVDAGDGLFASAERYLPRQTASLGGGTTGGGPQRDRERVLGVPREYAADKGVPFNQVKRGRR
jgi:hypothetical protein